MLQPVRGHEERQPRSARGTVVSVEPTDPAGGTAPGSKAYETRWTVLATLMLATVLANVASVCLFPQIVVLSTEFGRPVNEVVWIVIAFDIIATGVGGVAAARRGSGDRRRLGPA